MYEPKQEPREFVADSRDAAIAKARAFFGAEELRIQEYRGGEVYGLGGRTLVVAVPRDRRPPARDDRERDRGRERGGRDRERGGRDRERGGRGTRERTGGGGRPRAEAAPAEPSVGSVEGELGEIGRFVLGAIERLSAGPFVISESSEEGITIVHLKGPAAEALGGGEARAVDALQLLANQAALRQDEEAPRVVLDVEGHSESRERHLERLAERVMHRAQESGRAVALDPMNGRDRRIVHLAVRGQDGVATMSIGEGRYRQVVVVPEGAPEYEEALRSSSGAAETSSG